MNRRKANKQNKLVLPPTGDVSPETLRLPYNGNVVLDDGIAFSFACFDRGNKYFYDYILSSSKSICRYKDYILKRTIKAKIKNLIDKGIISRTEDICISIYIDEQLTATDGIYGLRETIKEELQYGIKNYNYDTFYPPLFAAQVDVQVEYCESKSNYMIQACDILANRIFASYKYDKPDLRKIPNHNHLTYP